MRRRRLITFTTRLSLALGVLCMALWASTHLQPWRPWQFGKTFVRPTDTELSIRFFGFSTDPGAITFIASHYHVPLQDLSPVHRKLWETSLPSLPRPLDWRPWTRWAYRHRTRPRFYGFGFDFGYDARIYSVSGVGVTFSFRSLTVLFLILPTASAGLRIRRALRAGPDGKPLKTLPRPSAVTLEHERRNRARANRVARAVSTFALILCLALLLTLVLTYPAGCAAQFTTSGHRLVIVSIQNAGLFITTAGNWPQSQPLRIFALPENNYHPLYPYRDWRETNNSQRFFGRVFAEFKANMMIFLEPDGQPMRLPYGIDAAHGRYSAPLPYYRLIVSLRAFALAPAILPIIRFALFIRRIIRRRLALNRNLCINCHYSLAHNTTGTCPECGTPFAPPKGVRSPSSP